MKFFKIFPKTLLIISGISVVFFIYISCSTNNVNDGRGLKNADGNVYAGSQVCANCHSNIYSDFSHTAHFHTSSIPTDQNIKGSFLSGENIFPYDYSTFMVMEKRNGKFYQTEYQNGKETRSEQFYIVIGSGTRGQSYLYIKDSQLYQLPISYFTSSHSWANSPGFPFYEPLFTRYIRSRCLECHSTFADMSTLNIVDKKNKPKNIILGIECESCHGPAEKHVEFQQQNAAGAQWQVASQLHRGTTAFEFTAPNLQYLMDSPTEVGPVSTRQFEMGGRTFRFSAHHTGTAAELDAFVANVEKIVKVQGAIFGEYPAYEPGSYTFIADYLPYAHGDGMEHRNSTVITSPGSIAETAPDLLDAVAHEFFHGWNVERIRPQSLEPFDFERANMSGELWLAEGFTQYYGPLALSRAGLADLGTTASTLSSLIESIVTNPGRESGSAEDMSRMAPFTDGGKTIDRTNWPDTYISYYPFGGAIALGLDLSLRGRSSGRVTLDDFMRAMWQMHGKPGGTREGYVDRPYTLADVERRLAEVSGDAAFARDFFARYVDGRDVPDYARLLEPAGFVLRHANPGRAWWGDLSLDQRGGVRVAAAPLANTPAYKAGLDVDDEIRQIDGARVTTINDVRTVLGRHKPGDVVVVEFVDRTGSARSGRVVLGEDPHMVVASVESTGGTLTAAQRAFRQAWLFGE